MECISYEPLGELGPKILEEVVDWNMMNFNRQDTALGIFDGNLESVDDYIEYYGKETDYDEYLVTALAEFDIELNKKGL